MSSRSKDELIALLRQTAARNGDRPLGAVAFYRKAGVAKEDLWNVGLRSYGDLCELAGFRRNRLQGPMDPDQLLEKLAFLAAKLQRWPDNTDRKIAHLSDPTFPSYEAYRTARNKRGSLEQQLLDWCSTRPQYSEVQRAVEARLAQSGNHSERAQLRKVVNGYVYLFRYGNHGRDYKIGMSEDASRRHSQLSAVFPGQLPVVHVIETDDPRGIEQYWHQRFEAKRIEGKKEIFRLDPLDIAAFRSRKYQ